MSYVGTLTICLLLVYFVAAAGCHCFDLSLSQLNKKLFEGSLQRLFLINIPLQLHKKTPPPPTRKITGILHYNTQVKTLSNLNTRLAIVWFCMYQLILISSGKAKTVECYVCYQFSSK